MKDVPLGEPSHEANNEEVPPLLTATPGTTCQLSIMYRTEATSAPPNGFNASLITLVL